PFGEPFFARDVDHTLLARHADRADVPLRVARFHVLLHAIAAAADGVVLHLLHDLLRGPLDARLRNARIEPLSQRRAVGLDLEAAAIRLHHHEVVSTEHDVRRLLVGHARPHALHVVDWRFLVTRLRLDARGAIDVAAHFLRDLLRGGVATARLGRSGAPTEAGRAARRGAGPLGTACRKAGA